MSTAVLEASAPVPDNVGIPIFVTPGELGKSQPWSCAAGRSFVRSTESALVVSNTEPPPSPTSTVESNLAVEEMRILTCRVSLSSPSVVGSGLDEIESTSLGAPTEANTFSKRGFVMKYSSIRKKTRSEFDAIWSRRLGNSFRAPRPLRTFGTKVVVLCKMLFYS